MTAASKAVAEKEKQDAARSSVFAAVFLTVLKLVVGLMTGSLGVLAEATHSALDLVAALVTLFAVRYSDQPPDIEHLYGHGKMEHLSALVETLLLLITSAWIIYEAIQRLFFETEHVVDANIWAFLVMGISIVVDISRSRMLSETAEKYNSQALEADALHFRTDIWSSLTVIAGLTLVWLGQRLGTEWAWLAKADAVAALMVALIVIYVSLQLGRDAVSALLDAAPPGLAEQIRTVAGNAPGVEIVGPVRVRQSGAATFADITVGVDRSASLEEAHRIAAIIESGVLQLSPESDVVVHIDPVHGDDESLPQAVSAVAGRFGLRTHKVHAHEIHGELYLDLDVEVPGELSLDTAHTRVTQLESALKEELANVKEINTHIEPISTSILPNPTQIPESRDKLRARIVSIVEAFPELTEGHNIRIWPVQGGYEIVIHCLADPELSIANTHHLAEQLEKQLLAHVAGISQVLIHVEPESDH